MAAVAAMNSISGSTCIRGTKVLNARFVMRAASRRPATIHCEAETEAPPPPAPKWSKTMNGGSAPFGDRWDPLNYLACDDENQIKLYREAELTHGRVAMLASLGFVVGEKFNPLFGGKITGPAIYHFQQVPGLFWGLVVFGIALAEGSRLTTGWKNPVPGTNTAEMGKDETPGLWKLNADYVPGDLGFDPLGLKPTDKNELAALQTKEINNGRLAMFAIMGMIGQELATGEKLF